MPQFNPPNDIYTADYDEFTRGYLEALFWIGICDDEEIDSERPYGTAFAVSDIDPRSLNEILAECIAFQESNAADLESYVNISERSMSHAGHDFYLTRNGHGAGFWDRGLDDLGEKLSKASKVYGSQGLYLGDDGKLYNHN